MHRGGNAQKYHADTKYKEAVAEAAEACADDTKGQTCYICTEALHWKTKEGLVRGCACRGTAGVAHVSCLAEQAKILFAEAEENNVDVKAKNERLNRWHKCSLCEQDYHGVVQCALGWASWKTYVGRPEEDQVRGCAMTKLGNGLSEAGHDEDALSVKEAELSELRRLGAPEMKILAVQGNLANTYQSLGRLNDALRTRQDVYSGKLRLYGEDNKLTLLEAFNYATLFCALKRFEEAKSLLRKNIPVARRVLRESDEIILRMRCAYAVALYKDDGAPLDDLREAVDTLEETAPKARRVLGSAHPLVEEIRNDLRRSRATLAAARETPP